MKTRQKKHRPDEIVAKLHDADAMLNAGKDLAAVLQALEVSDSTLDRWRAGHRREAVVVRGMKREEAKRLTHLEDENRRLKRLVADLSSDNQMLERLSEGNWKALPGSERQLSSFGRSSASLSETTKAASHQNWESSHLAQIWWLEPAARADIRDLPGKEAKPARVAAYGILSRQPPARRRCWIPTSVNQRL